MTNDCVRACSNPKAVHVGTWARFNRYLGEAARGLHGDGGVGIWHEAYQV